MNLKDAPADESPDRCLSRISESAVKAWNRSGAVKAENRKVWIWKPKVIKI
jgi:hypothetical protein